MDGFLPAWTHLPGLPGGSLVRPADLVRVSADPSVWMVWDLHPSVLLGIGSLAAVYTWMVLRYRPSRCPERPVEGWRVVSFAAALACLLVALDGPIHHLSDYFLFSAHMAQHLLLTQVFAPLFILGLPSWMLRPLLQFRPAAALLRVLTRPVVAFIVYNGVVWFWHTPRYYDWTMRDHDVHIVEHLSFLVVACLSWWPATGSSPLLPRPSYLLQVLYLFLLTVTMKVTGAYIALQTDLLYPFYSYAPRVFGLTPVGDQAFGGMLMWLVGDWPLWLAMGVIFWRWWQRTREGSTGSLEKGDLPLPA